jgi:RNA polymerase sigma-70 factor (ECF subfamily)
MNECVRLYLDRLPASYRSVLLFSEDEGLTNQQIAETLGISLEAAKIRLHRARGRLRKELGGGCDVYRDDRNELACEPKTAGVSRSG